MPSESEQILQSGGQGASVGGSVGGGWGAAIGAVLGVGDGIIGVAGSRSAQKRALRYSKELYDYQLAQNYNMVQQMWQEYNSPSAQMRNLKKAGLNPNLVYGSGNAISQQDVPGASMSKPEVYNNYAGVHNALELVSRNIIADRQAQIQQQNADTNVRNADTRANLAESQIALNEIKKGVERSRQAFNDAITEKTNWGNYILKQSANDIILGYELKNKLQQGQITALEDQHAYSEFKKANTWQLEADLLSERLRSVRFNNDLNEETKELTIKQLEMQIKVAQAQAFLANARAQGQLIENAFNQETFQDRWNTIKYRNEATRIDNKYKPMQYYYRGENLKEQLRGRQNVNTAFEERRRRGGKVYDYFSNYLGGIGTLLGGATDILRVFK